MNYFTFNGESSADYGVYVGGQSTYTTPARSYTSYTITGRNGALIKDNGRFENVSISYGLVITEEFASKAAEVEAWLKAPTSYCRLEDTYHSEYYRMAVCTDAISFETTTFNRMGKTEITFNCKPQKWLKSGENAVRFTAAGTLSNPTRFPALPLIRVYGTGKGTVTVGNQTISISGISEYVDIDCELQDCFKGTANCNSAVTLGDEGFPTLESGDTGISFSGKVTAVEVTPRWWTI